MRGAESKRSCQTVPNPATSPGLSTTSEPVGAPPIAWEIDRAEGVRLKAWWDIGILYTLPEHC